MQILAQADGADRRGRPRQARHHAQPSSARRSARPWTYAALERGMEAYPGQPTVRDLNEVYHYRAIDKHDARSSASRASASARPCHGRRPERRVRASQLPARCLPMGVGNVKLFRKVIDAVKLAGAVIDAEHRRPSCKSRTEPNRRRGGRAAGRPDCTRDNNGTLPIRDPGDDERPGGDDAARSAGRNNRCRTYRADRRRQRSRPHDGPRVEA